MNTDSVYPLGAELSGYKTSVWRKKWLSGRRAGVWCKEFVYKSLFLEMHLFRCSSQKEFSIVCPLLPLPFSLLFDCCYYDSFIYAIFVMSKFGKMQNKIVYKCQLSSCWCESCFIMPYTLCSVLYQHYWQQNSPRGGGCLHHHHAWLSAQCSWVWKTHLYTFYHDFCQCGQIIQSLDYKTSKVNSNLCGQLKPLTTAVHLQMNTFTQTAWT